MLRIRSIAFRALLVGSITIGALLPRTVSATGPADVDTSVTLTAYLDGKPIPLTDVVKYYCDDFSYPAIRCSSSELVTQARAATMALLTAVEYVTVYDQPGFGGSYMNVSQDYSVLALIGWNDRISSFKARNSETGRFYVDWLYSGSQWSFCCNTQQPSLGGYDNTFSSVQRT